MNCRWHEIINDTAFYYQNYFNISKIAEQLSDYNDILRKQMQEKIITGTNISFISSSMRATEKACTPEDSSVMKNKSEEIKEEEEKAV